jgi:alpha-tubulin suppressor-like RCC1 family protein
MSKICFHDYKKKKLKKKNKLGELGDGTTISNFLIKKIPFFNSNKIKIIQISSGSYHSSVLSSNGDVFSW